MKKYLIMLLTLVLLVGCSTNETSVETMDESDATSQEVEVVEESDSKEMTEDDSEMDEVDATDEMETMVETEKFNEETLAKYNGENGMASYIAVDGVVYDVTGVKAWETPHRGKYKPGMDYSDEIRKAPHGMSTLENLPVVGTYE